MTSRWGSNSEEAIAKAPTPTLEYPQHEKLKCDYLWQRRCQHWPHWRAQSETSRAPARGYAFSRLKWRLPRHLPSPLRNTLPIQNDPGRIENRLGRDGYSRAELLRFDLDDVNVGPRGGNCDDGLRGEHANNRVWRIGRYEVSYIIANSPSHAVKEQEKESASGIQSNDTRVTDGVPGGTGTGKVRDGNSIPETTTPEAVGISGCADQDMAVEDDGARVGGQGACIIQGAPLPRGVGRRGCANLLLD